MPTPRDEDLLAELEAAPPVTKPRPPPAPGSDEDLLGQLDAMPRGIFGEQSPDNAKVQKTVADQQHRDLGNTLALARSIGPSARAGDMKGVTDALGAMQTQAEVRRQMGGGEAVSPGPKVTGEGKEAHLTTPGFVEKYVMAPSRARAALLNPAFPGEWDRKGLGMLTDPNGPLAMAADAALDPSAPDLPTAMVKRVEGSGEKTEVGKVRQVLNKAWAREGPLGQFARGVASASPLEAAGQEQGVIPGALAAALELGRGVGRGVVNVAKGAVEAGKAQRQDWETAKPTTEPSWMGLTKTEAALAGGLADLASPDQLVLGPAAKGTAGAARLGAKGLEVAGTAAKGLPRVGGAIQAAEGVVRPVTDAVSRAVRGTPASMEQALRTAQEAGAAPTRSAEEMTRAFREIGPKTNLALEPLRETVEGAAGMSPRAQELFQQALVAPEGAARDVLYQQLHQVSPAAAKSLDKARAGGLTAAELKPGMAPAQALAERGIRSATEGVMGEFVEANIKPLARAVAPDGAIPKGYVKVKTLDNPHLTKALGDGAAIPEQVAKLLAQEAKQPGALAPLLSAWKFAVTAGSGPAYHFNNNAYSGVKLFDRYGAAGARALPEAEAILNRTPGAKVMGKSVEELNDLAARWGTARGTGESAAAKGQAIRDLASGKKPSALTAPLRKYQEGMGGAAQNSDEFWRVATAAAEARKNGGNWEAAFDFADKYITHTRDAPPILKGAVEWLPFAQWVGKEVPQVVKAVARGEAKSPYVAKAAGQALAPTDTKVPESMLPDRMLEQAAIPLGTKDEAGQPQYLPQRWSAGPTMQTLDPVYRAVRGEPALEVAKSAGKAVAGMMLPPYSLGLQLGSGQKMGSGKGLDQLQKAGPLSEAAARVGLTPPWVTVVDDNSQPRLQPDGTIAMTPGDPSDPSARFLSTGAGEAVAGMFPFASWAKVGNAAVAGTPEEFRRNAAASLGAPVVPVDWTREAQAQQMALAQKSKDRQAIVRKLQGK